MQRAVWQDRLAEWLADTGCDAWVLRSYARSAAAYASERIGGMMPYSPITANQRFDEWMDYYRARGVEEIHGGILAMRRRSGKNWMRIERCPWTVRSRLASPLLELFANRTVWRRTLDGPEMAWKPRLPSDTRIDQQLRLVAGSGSHPRCNSAYRRPPQHEAGSAGGRLPAGM